MKKKILSGVLALCMIFGSAAALPEGVFETGSTITASADSTSGKYSYEISDGKAIITSYNGKESKVVIPSKLGGKPVVKIDDNAFSGNENIQNVFLPSTLETIEDCAFKDCTKLAEIKIPAKTATIEQEAFAGCTKLRKVTFETGVNKKIGVWAFQSCNALTELDLGGSVTYIGEGAFQGCNHLKKLVIPDSVEETGGQGGAIGAFVDCTALTEVTIGIGLVNLGANTFNGCSNLSKVTLGRNVKLIGNFAFIGTKLTSITIPASVTQIGEEAFKDVKTLKTVKIESGKNKTIDNFAFSGCTGLTSVDLGKSVTSIGTYAFEDCTALTSINIPDSVTGIYRRAFLNCTKLAKVTIGNGVKLVGYNAFGNCSALKTVSFGAGIEKIEDYAFEYCSSLEKVVLMPNTSKIGTAAFGSCTSLKSVIMPGVQEIGEKAFQDDIKLSEVVMGEGNIGKIAYRAFLNNESLTKVVIPESAVDIGTEAFGYNDQGQKRKGFTIYGVKGSDANAYANDNGFKFVAIAKHTCNYEKVVVPNTCTEKGYTVNVCKICGKVKETNTVKAAGHKWSEWKVVTTANCAHAGLKTHYCTVCGKYETAEIAKTKNHKWSDWKTTGFSFKNKTSTQKRTCSVCKKSSTRTNQGAIKRLAGDNRYATAAKLSSTMYKTANTVVLATGLTYQDALVAVPLAAAYDAPLLLGTEKHITDQTLAELKRLKAKNVIVVSTNGAIGSKAKAELKGYKVTSIAGKNYYETATKVAKALQTKTKKAPDTIFFATDSAFADALSASPIAAIKNAPIIYLKNKGSIDSATAAYLKSVKGKVKNAYVIGGDGVISNAMMKNVATALGLKSGKTVVRVAGKNRYETCVAVNKKFKSVVSSEGICVAKGLDFPDALAGGVYAASTKQALFLADGNKLQDVQSTYLKGKNAAKITALGGTGAVSDDLVKVIIKASI